MAICAARLDIFFKRWPLVAILWRRGVGGFGCLLAAVVAVSVIHSD
jgi:hypothetical protein